MNWNIYQMSANQHMVTIIIIITTIIIIIIINTVFPDPGSVHGV